MYTKLHPQAVTYTPPPSRFYRELVPIDWFSNMHTTLTDDDSSGNVELYKASHRYIIMYNLYIYIYINILTTDNRGTPVSGLYLTNEKQTRFSISLYTSLGRSNGENGRTDAFISRGVLYIILQIMWRTRRVLNGISEQSYHGDQRSVPPEEEIHRTPGRRRRRRRFFFFLCNTVIVITRR